MPNRDNFPAVFARLRGLLQPLAPHLTTEADTDESYALNAPPSGKYPKGLFFGSALVGKSAVSYHLMPIYVFPDLLDDLPETLRKRKQGKSCFNFTRLDEETIAALERLTAASFARYQDEQIV